MRRLSLLVLLVLVLGCSKSTPPSADAGGAAPVGSLSLVADAGAASISEPQVKKVLDAWLATQNASEFAKYEALYAPRFEGVRRSGSSQVARLDRARWMKERAAMFKGKMTVAMKDVAITTSHDGGVARFVQTWANETYRDEGPKQMVLARVGADLKIAREELLSSTVIPPGTVPLDRFAFAVEGGSGGSPVMHLVLNTKPDDEWASGAPVLVAMKDKVVTKKPVVGAKLPADLAAWKGKKVELFGPSGPVCEGSIGELVMLDRVTPHFGTVARWTGTGDFQGEPKLPPAQVASEAWGLSGEGRLITGEVKVELGDCKKALWGRAASTEKVAVVEAKKADATTRTAMLTELRKSKAYADLQKTYMSEKDPKDPPRWEDFTPTVTALVLDHPSGTKIMTLSISAGAGCGTFGGTLSAAWIQQKDTTLTLIRDPSGEDLLPTSAADVDNDGQIDLIFDEAIMHAKPGNKLDPRQKLNVPFLDCGC